MNSSRLNTDKVAHSEVTAFRAETEPYNANQMRQHLLKPEPLNQYEEDELVHAKNFNYE